MLVAIEVRKVYWVAVTSEREAANWDATSVEKDGRLINVAADVLEIVDPDEQEEDELALECDDDGEDFETSEGPIRRRHRPQDDDGE